MRLGEVLARMGLEGQHAGRQAAFTGIGHQAGEDGLVTQVDAIEVADGERAGPAFIGGGEAAKDFHAGIGAGVEWVKL